MALELDHVFICCSVGAPEGDALVRLGVNEARRTLIRAGNRDRRFFFRNAFLELL
jgi:hypothetical protein